MLAIACVDQTPAVGVRPLGPARGAPRRPLQNEIGSAVEPLRQPIR